MLSSTAEQQIVEARVLLTRNEMAPYVDRFVERLRDAEEDLRLEIEEQHRRLKQGIPAYIREGSLLNLLTAPIIYSLIVPLAILDLWTTLYQWVCFPIYGVACVPRGSYFVLDRHRLAYLNGIEKVNCTFCSYANGLIAYVREVAARTELYWCPIKHARAIASPHQRYHHFLDYGDARGYRRALPVLRHTLRREVKPRRKG